MAPLITSLPEEPTEKANGRVKDNEDAKAGGGAIVTRQYDGRVTEAKKKKAYPLAPKFLSLRAWTPGAMWGHVELGPQERRRLPLRHSEGGHAHVVPEEAVQPAKRQQVQKVHYAAES